VVNHAAIYAAHPDVAAVVNAYPVNATAFTVTDVPLDTRTIPESYIFLREVRRASREAQYGTGADLARLVHRRHPVLLLQNNGVMVCGSSVLDAFDRLEVLESTAEAMINARPLGELVPMPKEVITALTEKFLGE
jgi:L-fuculose-phosphate aldolase